jgi:spore maturation protein CgeB
MRIVLFCHSLVSDWNHGNAHFIRGTVRDLLRRGHEVTVYEPEHAWSRRNLLADHGKRALDEFRNFYWDLSSVTYDLAALDLDEATSGASLVLVHEWNSPELVSRLSTHRKSSGARYQLLFHETHHRAASAPDEVRTFDLSGFDGVLAFGEVIRDIYLRQGWTGRAWTWHEAADITVFHPLPTHEKKGELVWIGNWGDDERTVELDEFLISPVRQLQLRATVRGVRYPPDALQRLAAAGIVYGGYLPNYHAPWTYAEHLFTLHIPRRFYARALPGIPTIRVFEALACGIPLISAPWDDAEGLFTPGCDYLVACNGQEMIRHLAMLREDATVRRQLARRALETIRARHTCAHRVDELLSICDSLGLETGNSSGARAGPALRDTAHAAQ